MASVNRVIILGNCGRDPELRYLQSGMVVANVSIATTSKRKDKATGEMIEDTQWHRVQFFDRLAEIAGEFLKKGKPVYVEGRLKYGKYTDKDGVERSTCDIVAESIQLIGTREDGAQPRQAAPAPAPQPQRQAPTPRMPGDDDDFDIPF